jgi:cell wall-associated NlpC family hydrolase
MKRNHKVLKWAVFFSVAAVLLYIIQVSSEKPKRNSADKLVESDLPETRNNSGTGLKDSIVNFGTELLGTPYAEAGCTRAGFDCSGFVYFVFGHFRIKVPRSSADFEHFGKEIPIENVEKGDLLLFLSPTRDVIGHMGIVSNPKGRESEFIHATSGGERKVVITSLADEGYTTRFVKAVRVL